MRSGSASVPLSRIDSADRRTLGARPGDAMTVFCGRIVSVMAAVLAFVVLATPTFAEPKPDTMGLPVAALTIEAKPIAYFDKSKPGEKRFGRLEFRGGLELTSSDRNFGGLSGITIEADGKRFAAVTDAGAWLTGEIAYDGTRPKGITGARMGPLLAAGAKTLTRDRDRDAEAIALADGNLTKGAVYIGFERNQRIGRFEIANGVIGAPAAYLKMPPEARRMSANKGLEAVGVMQGGPLKGAVIAFAERLRDKPTGHHTGWLWTKGEPHRLLLKDIDEFDVTGAAGLPNGDLLVLERRFRWLEGVRMRLRLVKAGDIRAGAVLAGEVLIAADMGAEIDNMEGVAAHRGARGETIITLISDDNFNHFLQRNLLLQFALSEPGQAAAAKPR